jgi:hypothetical protein
VAMPIPQWKGQLPDAKCEGAAAWKTTPDVGSGGIAEWQPRASDAADKPVALRPACCKHSPTPSNTEKLPDVLQASCNRDLQARPQSLEDPLPYAFLPAQKQPGGAFTRAAAYMRPQVMWPNYHPSRPEG